ncbi:hypothetical protein PO909_004274 [Leuciscus waleckii]
MALAAVSLYLLALAWANLRPVHGNNRHAVYWNSSNLQRQCQGVCTYMSLLVQSLFLLPHWEKICKIMRKLTQIAVRLTLGPAEVDKLAVESVEHFMWALVSGITLTPHPGTHIAETDKRAD